MQPNERRDHVYVAVSKRLADLPDSPFRPSIFRVHSELRNVNEMAYEPFVVAIGPYHRGKDHLRMMEEHKLHYLNSLLKRKNKSVEKLVAAMISQEQEARRCYAEPISLGTDEFIDIMLLDGCFIIELFSRFETNHDDDPIFEMKWSVSSLQRDLLLFENQLPFFILLHLYDEIEGSKDHKKFIRLAWNFFRGIASFPNSELAYAEETVAAPLKFKHLLSCIYTMWQPSTATTETDHGNNAGNSRTIAPIGIKRLLSCIYTKWQPSSATTETNRGNNADNPRAVAPLKIKHLLSCICAKWRPSSATAKTNRGNDEDNHRFIPCASELSSAGVKFEKVKDSNLFGIRLKDRSLKNPGVVIKIPCLMIEDNTEALFRNLIAYEQYCSDSQYIADYLTFMDCLINSVQDVGILRRRGIINNWLGDDKAVSAMFNKLVDSITLCYGDFRYADIFKRVNEHCRKPKYKWMEILWRNYLNSPWAYISVIAAIVLLVLTLLQTIYTIKS